MVVTDSSGRSRDGAVTLVSPTRIDLQIPPDSSTGPARITVRSSIQLEQTADLRIDSFAPALFSANRDGTGVGAVTALRVGPNGRSWEPVFAFDDSSNRFIAKPIVVSNSNEPVYLSLFGTGILGTGARVIEVLLGDTAVPVIVASPQSQFIGLSQLDIGPLPRSLAGTGTQPVLLSVDGKRAANVVTIEFQ